MIDPHIDNRVVTYGASPHKFATPQTEEVITDTACSSACVPRNPRHVSQTGRDCTTPGDCNIYVRFPWNKFPVLTGGIGVLPTRGHIGSLDVLNKRQSTSPSASRNNQKFDASVDRNLANDGYSKSIFSKLIGRELFHSPRFYIYSRCRMDFVSNVVGNEVPNFVDLGLLAVNASD